MVEINFKQKLNAILLAVIVCPAICLMLIIFYNQSSKVDAAQTKAMETLRQAQVNLIDAEEKSIVLAKEKQAYDIRQDSLFSAQNEGLIQEIKKVRNNEKIISISRYNSADLTRAFAELEK